MSRSLLRKTLLLTADAACYVTIVILSFWVAALLRMTAPPLVFDSEYLRTSSIVFGMGLLVLLYLSNSWGHYRRFRPIWTEALEIVKICAYLAFMILAVLFLTKTEFSRLWLGTFIGMLAFALPGSRCAAKKYMMRRGYWYRSTFIVGTGENALTTARALESDPWIGHQVEGFIDLDRARQPGLKMAHPVLDHLPDDVDLPGGADKPCYVFAFESLTEMNRHRRIFNRFIASRVNVTVSPPIRGLPLYGAEVMSVFKHDTVLLRLENNAAKYWKRFLKRSFDIFFSALGLLALSPLLLAIAIAVRRDGGPAFFAHARVGYGGRYFQCFKFRSMVVDGDRCLADHLKDDPIAWREWQEDQKLRSDPRVTRIGAWLRKTSLDELPQLLNVLMGDMSLVGPRPIVKSEVVRYGEHLPYYLSMLPGVTGLWQTSGRNDTDYQERVLLDVWYTRNWSLWHDIVILIRTVPVLLFRNGAY